MTKMRRKLLGEDVKRNSQEMERQAVVMPAMTAKQPFYFIIASLARSRSIVSMGTCSVEVYGDVHGKKSGQDLRDILAFVTVQAFLLGLCTA